MKPTMRSGPFGMTDPELTDVLALEVPVDTSRGFVGTTPENSWASSATDEAAVVTVMVVTDAALGAYHISPSERWPETCQAPTFDQVFFPSLIAVIG